MNENRKIKYGVMHTHTEYSKHDSGQSIEALVKRCAELGAPAIALTDHGLTIGLQEFNKICKEYKVQPIFGCEGYIKGEQLKELNVSFENSHQIFMAKTYEGLKAIYQIVSVSNKNIINDIPYMSIDNLKEFFGPGKKGHDQVIVTSACVGGILSRILLTNKIYNDKIAVLKNKQSKYSNPDSELYKKNQKDMNELSQKIENLCIERNNLNLLAKKVFVRKEKSVEALSGTDMYEEARKNLDAEINESKSAQEKLLLVRNEISKTKKAQTELKAIIDKQNIDYVNWKELEKEIKKYQKGLKTEEELFEEASKTAKFLEDIFGKGNFYIELQYHGIEEEAYVMPKLVKLAKLTGIPVVAANDVHTTTNSEEDLKTRQIMRSLKYNKWEERRVGDDQLYIKTDEELTQSLEQVIEPNIVKEAMENIRTITEACKFELPKLTHYPKFISDIPGESAEDRLSRLAREGIPRLYPNNWDNEKEERLLHELKVICSMGYANYFCIVEDYIKEARRLGGEGYFVGPARGSAAGSIVCYLTGITSVIDPILYGLFFERFLNEERVSMPDIDVDFHRDIRGKVIEYVKMKYGEKACCNINTKGRQMARGAIRNCARLLGSEKYNDPLYFNNLGDVIAKSIPKTPGIRLNDCLDNLKSKYKNNPDALEIINNARLVEGTLVSYGMHAAGIIISDSEDISEHVALLWDEDNNALKCQVDMNEAEQMGFLKMDFLGLKNLDIITNTLRSIKRRTGISIDIEKIEFEKEVFDAIFSKGFTNSVFQFESTGMKQMLREFKPDCFKDIILLVAAYRPGPMQYIPKILAVKNGQAKPKYIIPEMESVLGETYGCPIYQEQVMQIFNKFAGFSLAEADIIRRLMSKKKDKEFAKYKVPFINGMIKSGALKKDAEDFWNELVEFAKYAFNKSHAAAYAVISYQTAWLKYHYPLEFISETLSVLEIEKYQGLIADCKLLDIEVLAPNINLSEKGFSIQNDAILFGLSSVKNVGVSADEILNERETNGNFTSFHDYLIRGHFKKDVTESLIKAGAFDEFNTNRKALLYMFNGLEESNIFKKIKDKRKAITDINSSERKFTNAVNSLKILETTVMDEVIPEDYPNIQLDKLNDEKEMIGVFVTAHPTDEYSKAEEIGCVPILNLSSGKNVKALGLITNLRLANRKSDGKQMAFFTLEDKTGSIEVNCFTKAFDNYGSLINNEGKVVIIQGDIFEEESFFKDSTQEDNIENTDTINIELKLNMIKAFNIEPNLPKIIVHVPNLVDWTEKIHGIIRNYRSSSGNPLVVHDMMLEEFRETNIKVIAKDLINNKFGLKVSMV